MATAPNVHINDFFERREALFKDVEQCLDQLGALVREQAHPEETEPRQSDLRVLRESLQKRQLRIAVIGEFSRGKSSLLNALLGQNILPTAQQQTTAINTFIQGVPEGQQPHIEVVFKDGNTRRVSWDDKALESWATELDRDHSDVRQSVERVRVYSDHPLLQHELVLIDTPGFQGILPEHERIAKEAISSAHVALWLQSTDQLGGNASEWRFLRETLLTQFDKFITVVNKWDTVLEPQDAREQRRSEAERVERALSAVRDNFSKNIEGLGAHALDTLTDARHLIGVSAIWAFNDDLGKRRRSNVDQLAERITALFTSGEAQEQLLAGPLRRLISLTEVMTREIKEDLDNLESAKDLDAYEREIKEVTFEIRELEQGLRDQEQDFKIEHNDSAARFRHQAEQTRNMLTALRDRASSFVTEDYVRAHLRRGASAGLLTLPPQLKAEIEETTAAVQQDWEQLTVDMQESLGELSGRFNDKMNQISASLQGRLGRMSVHMPTLDTKVEIDLSAVFEHQNKAAALEEELRRLAEEHEQVRLESARIDANIAAQEANLHHAQRQMERLAQEYQSMGPPPPPVMRTQVEKRNRTGILGWAWQVVWGPQEVPVQVADYSAAQDHQQRKDALKKTQVDRERLVNEEFKKLQDARGAAATRQMAEERAEKKLRRAARQLEQASQESAEREAQQVQESLAALKRAGVDALERPIKRFDGWINGELQSIFDANLQALLQAAREHHTEPRENKRARLHEIETLIQKGQDEIDARKATLHKLLEELARLQSDLRTLQQEVRTTQGGA